MKIVLILITLAVFLLLPVFSYAQNSSNITGSYPNLKAEFKIIDSALDNLQQTIRAVKKHNKNTPIEQIKEDIIILHEIISAIEQRYGYNEKLNNTERQKQFLEK